MCTDVLPLIARTGTQLDLVVSRRIVTVTSHTDDVIAFSGMRRSSTDVPSTSSGFSEHQQQQPPTTGDVSSTADEKLTVLKNMKEDSV